MQKPETRQELDEVGGVHRPQRRSTGSHVAGFVGARIVAAVISACIGLIIPRALGVADSANYGIAVGMAMMLVVITDLGCTTSLAKAIADGGVAQSVVWRVVGIRYAIAVAAGACVAGVGLAAQAGWLSLGQMEPAYIVLAGLLVVAASLPAMATGVLPALRSVRVLLAVTVLQPMIELAGIAGAIIYGAHGGAIIVASIGAAGIAGIVGMIAVMRSIATRDSADGSQPSAEIAGDQAGDSRVGVATILAYGRPMFLVAIAFTLFGQVDQLVIYLMHGPEVAAPYIWSWRLIALLHLPALAAATIVAPRLAGAAEGRSELFVGWLRITGFAYLGIVGISVTLAPWLVPLALGKEKYGDAWPVFAALGPYAFLLGVAPLITMAANYLGGANERVMLGFTTITVNVVLDVALVPWLGVYGAAIGTTIAFSWYVLGHLSLTRRLLAANTHQHSNAPPQVPRSRGVAAGVFLLYSLGIAAVMAWVLAVLVDSAIPGVAGDIAALLGAGVSSFVLYLALGIRGLRRCGYDLRADLARDVVPAGTHGAAVTRGAA